MADSPLVQMTSETISFVEMKKSMRAQLGAFMPMLAGPAALVAGAGYLTAADATIDIGAENTNVRAITIQLKDAQGADVAKGEFVFAFVFADTGMAAWATGGSTGFAGGTDGTAKAIVAKQIFLLTCEADGDIDLTWTDTGTEAVYLCLWFPATGAFKFSAVIANT